MKLKAKRSKGKYKSTQTWLNAVYRNNKDFIDSRLEAIGYSKEVYNLRKVFIGQFYEKMAGNEKKHMPPLSPVKAMEVLGRTATYQTSRERILNNALSGLKKDKEAYKKFRELTKENGKYTKIDPSKFIWDDYSKEYHYGNIKIEFSNSPKMVFVGTW